MVLCSIDQFVSGGVGCRKQFDFDGALMSTEAMDAEKMRRKRLVQLLGTCPECGQPVKAGQEFLRTEGGIQHALCFYEPDFAKRTKDAALKSH